ncbi:hypothetical protein HY635_03430 [Candidatus Uhrbacteria bacterium]|nr:hypothetical protein [Candidatus Uhrbacteria bacterium]
MTRRQAMQRIREAFQEAGHTLPLTQQNDLEELMRAGVSLFDLFRIWQLLFGSACRDEGRRLLLQETLARRADAFRSGSPFRVRDLVALMVSVYR